jgi:hypothetical protein
MSHAEQQFGAEVRTIISRFVAQNGGRAIDDAILDAIAHRLRTVVRERGLPRPLLPHESGEPGGMPEDECARIVARVTDGQENALVAEAVRQLVKACFHPEFKTCRDSFREMSPDGSCRRQELARVRRRVSGMHCVDCPYWVTLDAEPHASFVAKHWHGCETEFAEHRAVFLPEDFRALRRWLHSAARRSAES